MTQKLHVNDVHQPLSGIAEQAKVHPRFERNVPQNQQPLTPADRPTPQRIQRKEVDPQVRLSEIESDLAKAIELASATDETYEDAINAPPTDEKTKAEALAFKLATQLREAQEALAEINARPEPLEVLERHLLGCE
jgi:hypothetical protein